MDKKNVTVIMPVTEYEKLQEIEIEFNKIVKILENANVDGKAVMTKELEEKILEIYC